MQDLIRSVNLKLARADSQVRTLADEISGWVSRNPITARVEFRDQRLGYRLILEEFEATSIENWGLLIGECAHNLRSALDNLAFGLARLRKDPPDNPAVIHFPIYLDRKIFEKNGKVHQSLNQMPPAAASLIEQLQPFQRDRSEVQGTPETDALVRLQWLNNHDKHRVPSIVLLAPDRMTHSWGVEYLSEEDAAANTPPDVTVSFDALHPGAVLLDYKTSRPIAKTMGEFTGKATVRMEIMNQRTPVVPTVSDLSYYTALIVDQFRHFFK